MWKSFSSYFIGSPEPVVQRVVTNESEWVVIDSSGEEISWKEVNKKEAEAEGNTDKRKSRSSSLNRSPHRSTKSKSSPLFSPSGSPSRMDGSWIITPPPCFTVKCPSEIQKSPLEDLLIEHPSMSVYGRLSNRPKSHKNLFSSHPQNNSSVEEDSEEDNPCSTIKHCDTSAHNSLENSPETGNANNGDESVMMKPICLIEKNEINSQEQSEINIFKKNIGPHLNVCDENGPMSDVVILGQIDELRKTLNIPDISLYCLCKPESTGETCTPYSKTHGCSPRKHQLSEKDRKKSSRASEFSQWIYKQDKLRSSNIRRQNRVYQIRNRHHQRNSHVVKPFGEKFLRF